MNFRKLLFPVLAVFMAVGLIGNANAAVMDAKHKVVIQVSDADPAAQGI